MDMDFRLGGLAEGRISRMVRKTPLQPGAGGINPSIKQERGSQSSISVRSGSFESHDRTGPGPGAPDAMRTKNPITLHISAGASQYRIAHTEMLEDFDHFGHVHFKLGRIVGIAGKL